MDKTTTNAGHEHTISNPSSGYTDAANGHRHRLSTGCSRCNRARRFIASGRMSTSFNRGHFHFFEWKDNYKV